MTKHTQWVKTKCLNISALSNNKVLSFDLKSSTVGNDLISKGYLFHSVGAAPQKDLSTKFLRRVKGSSKVNLSTDDLVLIADVL